MKTIRALLSLALSSCMLPGCASLPPPQRTSLAQACELYSTGDSAVAGRQLDAIIQQYPNADEIAEAHYVRGLCRMKSEQLADAAADFQAAVEKSRREELTARSEASLAAVAYRQGEWGKAAELYETALQNLPPDASPDEVAFSAGVALQRAGRWKDAALQFGRVIRTFPNSSVAAQAHRLVSWPHEYFTIQLAVYANSDQASAAVESYKTKGVDAYVESMSHEQRIVWVVMTGKHPTYDEAQTGSKRVQQIEPKAVTLP